MRRWLSGESIGAVVFALLMVLSPMGSVAVAPASAGTGPVDGSQHDVATAGSTSAGGSPLSAFSPSGAEFDDPETNETKISPAVAVRLAQSREDDEENETGADLAADTIPVIVVLQKQPREAFDFRGLAGEVGREKMISFANDQQADLLDYLHQQRKRGQATDIKSFWIRNLIAVEATPETIQGLARSPDVDRIIYDQRIQALNGSGTSPLAPLLDQLREHGNVSAGPQGFEGSSSGDRVWSVEYIGADDVHERGITGDGVNVSVVDTGIDDDHPALAGKVIRWKDFVNASNTEPTDPNGHGTHVAGTIAGKRDAKYAVGTAPGANLFGARVLDGAGTGNLSDLLDAFEWSANQSADIISASLGVSPILDIHEGDRSVATGDSSKAEFPVYANASAAVNDTASVSIDGFKPSYVYVFVEPIDENGSDIEYDEHNQSRVMRNLSVALEDPSGNRTLEKNSAGWVFIEGKVPDPIGLWKFKPNKSEPVMGGNWTLRVNSSHDENVSYFFQTVPVYPTNGSDETSRFVDNLATTQDVIPVIAAGNYGVLGNRTLGSPGAAAEAVTVGATGYATNDVAGFSSRGPVDFGNDTRPGVDLIAPGVGVVSTIPADLTVSGDYDDAYAAASGTSMATPHVSGVAALLLDADSSLTREDVTSTLRSTAQDVPYAENAVGAGALDAWAAVNSTVNLTAREVETEKGVRQLFAGIGGTGSTYVSVEIEPVPDPEGDAGNAPDIRAVSGSILDNFELVTHGTSAPNATFTVYIDGDKNDSTGDTANRGAEFKVVAVRTLSDGIYDLQTETFEYNGSGYETTTNLTGAYPGTVQGDFIEFFSLRFENRNLTDPFEWHVVSSPTGGSDTDEAPGSGQIASPKSQNISGLAVSWNSTAAAPATNEPITFKLYNQATGELIGNKTARTDADGRAAVEFTADVLAEYPYDDFELVIEDSTGNEISQTYRIYSSCVEGCLTDPTWNRVGNFTVDDRDYEVRVNGTVDVNIPIYDGRDDNLIPFNGTASVRLGHGSDAVIRNDIPVRNGVARFTLDFSNTTIDENEYFESFHVTLGQDIQNASSSELVHAGGVEFSEGAAETTLGPPVTVTGPGESVSLSFQNSLDEGEPANVSIDHFAIWIKTRHVAALFADLPRSTVEKIKTARQQAYSSGKPTVTFTASDRREIREARRNLSRTEGISINVTTGSATPVAKGVGTFSATPPEDARFGFVFGVPNTTSIDATDAYGGFSVVFVNDRILQYQRTPTAPSEEDRYDLFVEGYWDDHVEGNYVVPNDTMRVDVALYDTENDTYVDNATVRLYATSGNTTTVTTSGDGFVTTEVAAPDIDWVNSSYDQRRQQVVGIAEGVHTAEGKAVTGEEFFWGSVYEVGTTSEDPTTYAEPQLTYDDANDTLRMAIEYRNSSTWKLTNATRTLVKLATPNLYDAERDINVSFVDPSSNKTSITLNFSESVPSDVARDYEGSTMTGGMDWDWEDWLSVSGAQVTLDTPEDFVVGQSSPVTATVRDRNGDPIPNAMVVLRVVDVTEWTSSRGPLPDGETLIGITGSDGTVTFDVAPPAGEVNSSGDRHLHLEAGFATENTSDAFGASTSVSVSQDTVNLTGRFETADGTPAVDDVIEAFSGGNSFGPSGTDANGNFSLQVPANGTYALTYAQGNHSQGTQFSGLRDGSPDIFLAGHVAVGANDTDVGTITLPEAHVLQVKVVNESGVPVENAQVRIAHLVEGVGGTGTGFRTTNANGSFQFADADEPGIEIVNRTRVWVEPPEGDARFIDETQEFSLNVTANETLTVTLTEVDTTPPDVWNATATDDDGDGNVTDNDTVTVRAYANDSKSSFDVVANASAFGAGTVQLTHESGDLFTATFTVDAALAATNGSYAMDVTATDSAGNANTTTTNELQLNTSTSDREKDVGTVTASDVSGPPGSNVTVTFNATNVGDSDRGYIVRLREVPENFTIVSQSGDGGTWDGNDSWLYQTISPGESVHPSVTFHIPENASGDYSLRAELLTKDAVIDTARVNVSTTVSIAEAIDADDNGRIGDFEILDAIAMWRDSETVPGTGGKTIGDFKILELIELWRDGSAVG